MDSDPQAASPVASAASGRAEGASPAVVGASSPGPVERELLLRLSVAVQKFAIYPAGHPMRAGISEQLQQELGATLRERGELALAPARDRFLCRDLEVLANVHVLRDLLRRLRAHRVGVLFLLQGVQTDEIEQLLAALAGDPSGEPLASLPMRAVLIRPPGYDRLTLQATGSDLDTPGGTRQLWEEMARAALGHAAAEGDNTEVALAEALTQRRLDTAFTSVVAGYLIRILQALRIEARAGEGRPISMKLSSMLNQLDAATIRALVHLDGDARRRNDLVLSAAAAIAPDALIRLLGAAATEAGQDISKGLLRVLAKLAACAAVPDLDTSHEARVELQRTMGKLLSEWTLEDPTPAEYRVRLDRFSFERLNQAGPAAAQAVGPERVIEICSEVDTWGPAAERAVQVLLDEGQVALLLELLHATRSEGVAARELSQVLLTPRLVYLLTAGSTVDREALNQVVTALGEAAIEPLLDTLAESPSRSVRRSVFDCLAGLGPAAAERALGRARDPRWFVTRNMLALGASAPISPDFDPTPFLTAPDPRVRAQAVALTRRHPEGKQFIAVVLDDPEPKVVGAALRTLDGPTPAHLVDRLRTIAERSSEPEDQRLAVEALGRCTHPAACEALVALTGAHRSWLGRTRLGRKTPVTLAALQALAAAWQGHGLAGPVLRAAGRSRFGEIRRAARNQP